MNMSYIGARIREALRTIIRVVRHYTRDIAIKMFLPIFALGKGALNKGARANISAQI
jgi:hypothetical protein